MFFSFDSSKIYLPLYTLKVKGAFDDEDLTLTPTMTLMHKTVATTNKTPVPINASFFQVKLLKE